VQLLETESLEGHCTVRDQAGVLVPALHASLATGV